MTDIQSLIKECAEKDIKLWADGGRLRVDAPQGAIDDSLKTRLGEHKDALIAFLAGMQQPSATKKAVLAHIENPDFIPLTSSQARIWALANIDKGSSVYNVPVVFQVEGDFDIFLLNKALTEIQNRHEVLRTVFEEVDGQPRQVIKPPSHISVPIDDLWKSVATLDKKLVHQELMRTITNEVIKPFDFENGPLWRARAFRMLAQNHIIALTVHHIIFDGLSKVILLRELSEHYNALLRTQEPAQLEPLQIQFADFAIWQQQVADKAAIEKQRQYWQQKLEGLKAPLMTPNFFPRPENKAPATSLHFKFKATTSKLILQMASSTRSSPFVVLMATFAALLNRYTNQKDIVVCSPMASRENSALEKLIGYFNNIVPIRFKMDTRAGFSSLIKEVRVAALEAYDNQQMPLQEIAEFDNLARIPLTRAMLSYQESPEDSLKLGEAKTSAINVRKGAADFDLAIYLEQTGDRIGGVMDYNAKIFKSQIMERFIGRFEEYAAFLCANPEHPINRTQRQGKKPRDVKRELDQHPQIDQAIVVSNYDSGELNAYLILNEHDVPKLEDIKAYLKKKLPDYRVPAHLIPLDQFPLLEDGKIDHDKLPLPSVDRSYLSKQYREPESTLEKSLADIWKQVLWLDHDVGLDDSFRELGGHSLLSVQLVAEVEEQLDHTIPITALARISTVAEMAYAIEHPDEFNDAASLSAVDMELPQDMYRAILAHTASWEGKRLSPNSIIVGLNTDGEAAPIFWCLQRYQELQQLARYLGAERPVYGMRSGNRVMVKNKPNYEMLAAQYVKEITDIQPDGPLRIGGNCQAGEIAFYVARQLRDKGREIAVVILHERFVPEAYAGPIAMTYGKDSFFNPKYSFVDWQMGLRKYYSGPVMYQEVIGGHGQFFREPYVLDLAEKINAVLTAIDAGSGNLPYLLPAAEAPNSPDTQYLGNDDYKASYTLPKVGSLHVGQNFEVRVKVTNQSQITWQPYERSGIALTNRWHRAQKPHFESRIYTAHKLEKPLAPLETIEFCLSVTAPVESGEWGLEIDMVNDGISTFKMMGNEPYREIIKIS